jgi:hypothetical protein
LRRDRPQASRSRHCRAGRPILSPLIPGCSVAGDQDPSRLLIRARCRVGVRKVSPECELATPRQRPSAPRSQGGRLLAADGCASSLSNPACCFCGVWARGGPRGVAVAMFGLSLVWACSSAEMRALPARISISCLAYSLTDHLTLLAIGHNIFYRSDRESDRRLFAPVSACSWQRG